MIFQHSGLCTNFFICSSQDSVHLFVLAYAKDWNVRIELSLLGAKVGKLIFWIS